MGSGRPGQAGVALLAVLAAVLTGSAAFLLTFRAWPEMVAGGYFISRGMRLYDGVILPYTPVLLYSVAAAGKLLGFSASVFRSVMALSLGVSGVLLVAGVRPRAARRRFSPFVAVAVGAPLLVVLVVFTEGPALWPDPFLAPCLLAAGLALERFKVKGRIRALVGGGIWLGTAILIKQTAAWVALVAVLWAFLTSKRRRVSRTVILAAVALFPLALFYVAWGAAFGTVEHIRWTLTIPLLGGHAAEIGVPPTTADVPEALILFLAIPGLGLLARLLPSAAHRSSPMAWLALGSLGMAWPKWGLLHLGGAVGILSLVACRSVLVGVTAVRWGWRHRVSVRKLAGLALGCAALVVHLGTATLGVGPFVVDGWRGPTYYWDDELTRRFAAAVQTRVPPGGCFLDYMAPWDTVYPLTRTAPPSDFYVNPGFWFFLNKEDLDGRMVRALERRPGTLILFREPTPPLERAKETVLYRYLTARTQVVGRVDVRTTWRMVPEASGR